MGSKRKVAKNGSRNALPEYRILIELARRARHEVHDLWEGTKNGKITKREMNTGLKNVEIPMEQMVAYIEKTLKDVSKLRKAKKKHTKVDLKVMESRLQ